MNSTEQRSHRKVTEELARAVEAISEESTRRFEDLSGRLNEERTHRLKLADEQRAYVDSEDRMLGMRTDLLRMRIDSFIGRTFWQRLRWLLMGERR